MRLLKLIFLLPLLLLCQEPVLASTIDLNPRQPTTVSSPPRLQFQSAERCMHCHQDIYKEWKQSWMSKSYTNPVFQNDFARWKKYAPSLGKQPDSCLRCHAPAALLTGDIHFKNAVSKEGVSCTVCHKVAMTKEQKDQTFLVMDPRPILYGAKENTSIAGHEIRFSPAMADSSLCAGCHFDVEHGVPLERTYQEWKNSAYAKGGTQCMDCHMQMVNNSQEDKNNAHGRKHRSHRFPGGHNSSTLLKSAALVKVLPIADKSHVKVKVTNSGVGHNFPTGGAHPSRLILKIDIKTDTGGVLYSDEKIYEMTFLNEQGQPANGRDVIKSLQDSTLKPQESRTEIFELPELPGNFIVTATLVYELIPPAMASELPAGVYTTHYKPVIVATHSTQFSK